MTARPPAPPLPALIGHYTDRKGRTGCTVILCPDGAVGGVSVRGGAPCTRETDIFRPAAGVDPRLVHGVLLTGGSVFGLAACDGVVAYLGERGIGLRTGHACVPIVGAAGLYDLAVGDPLARPDAACGYQACAAATPLPVADGAVGAGTGATVGKALGMDRAMPGGLGIATRRLGRDTVVTAVVAVNAFGEVVDPATGAIVAGVRRTRGRGVEPIDRILDLGSTAPPPLANTTIGAVLTNAPLTKEEAGDLAAVAHDGIAQTVRPAHTRADGDTLFMLATGGIAARALPMLDLIALQHAAARTVADAIVRGVRAAQEGRST